MNNIVYILCAASAIAYSLAFFYPLYLGWLVLFFLIPIYCAIRKCKNSIQAVKAGFFWGLIAFGMHFAWLFRLFLSYSNLLRIVSLGLYITIILAFSCMAAIWFYFCFRFTSIEYKFLKYRAVKITIFCFLTFLFFRFLSMYGLFFLAIPEGYSFFSPLLALTRYRWFLHFYAVCCSLLNLNFVDFKVAKPPLKEEIIISDTILSNKLEIGFPIPLYYIHPDVEEHLTSDMSIVSQRIYHKLTALKLLNQKFSSPILVVTPEATFPFSLNENENQVKFWSNALPLEAYFLLGSYRSSSVMKNGEPKDKHYQSVFFIKDGKIIDFYDKTHAVPFFEKVPKFWKSYLWADQIFIKDAHKMSKGKNNGQVKRFNIPGYIDLIPQLCSEMFCDRSIVFNIDDANKGNSIIVWLVKESWFMNYFADLMESHAMLISIKLKTPILYVGYKKVIYFQIK